MGPRDRELVLPPEAGKGDDTGSALEPPGGARDPRQTCPAALRRLGAPAVAGQQATQTAAEQAEAALRHLRAVKPFLLLFLLTTYIEEGRVKNALMTVPCSWASLA